MNRPASRPRAGTLRVIAGAHRGRPLVAPAGDSTRPTADRVRETLFSMLVSRLGAFDGLLVADLFAGSGALGIEALSRGAARAVFVDQDPRAIAALRANLDRLALAASARVIAGSVLTLGPWEAMGQPGPPDLLLLDAPYGTSAGLVALERLARLGWVGAASLACIESARGEPQHPSGFEVVVERDVGAARLTLLRPA